MRNIGRLTFVLFVVVSSSVRAAPPREYQLNIQYTADVVRNFQGGNEQASRFLDNLDVAFSFPLGGSQQRRGVFLLSGVYNNAAGFSDLVGDLQGADNIDAPAAIRLYEMWYELAPTDSFSLKAGRMDLNSEFDVLENAQIFLHSSHGIGADFAQSGENGPSIFPVTTLGARVRLSQNSWSLLAAVYDAVPGDPDDQKSNRLMIGGGVLGVLELQAHWGGAKVLAGYWQYSDEFTLLNDPSELATASGNKGWYLGLEQSLGDWQGFVRYGVAESKFNVVEAYLGFGLVREGFRANHRMGVGVATAFTGKTYRALNTGVPHRERAIELTYDIAINPWFNVQFELQEVNRPAALPNLDAARVVGMRFTYVFEKQF